MCTNPVNWAAGAWRFLPTDFNYRSHHIERYGEDKLPEGNRIQDWPVSYEELEPYYSQVDWDIGVVGNAGNLNGEIQEGGNPFEGPRSRDYPLPPLAPSIAADVGQAAAHGVAHTACAAGGQGHAMLLERIDR